ncbi:MAG: lipocalin family protein [Desulfuromonadaceae bacterium]|nr:lipocalin family protein [Desulfuromonadaceae bacterium]
MVLKKLFTSVAALVTGCVEVPEGVKPVEPFELERYLGRWYAIARLDHSFERGLSEVKGQNGPTFQFSSILFLHCLQAQSPHRHAACRYGGPRENAINCS